MTVTICKHIFQIQVDTETSKRRKITVNPKMESKKSAPTESLTKSTSTPAGTLPSPVEDEKRAYESYDSLKSAFYSRNESIFGNLFEEELDDF